MHVVYVGFFARAWQNETGVLNSACTESLGEIEIYDVGLPADMLSAAARALSS